MGEGCVCREVVSVGIKAKLGVEGSMAEDGWVGMVVLGGGLMMFVGWNGGFCKRVVGFWWEGWRYGCLLVRVDGIGDCDCLEDCSE